MRSTTMNSPANSEAITWAGNLNSDCTAQWAGLLLHAEEMERTFWVWAVYDEKTNEVISNSSGSAIRATSGKKARFAAETAARGHIEKQTNA